MCVDDFPSSARRPLIFAEFHNLYQIFLSSTLCVEFWCNGSFLTEKPEPDDVDIVLSAHVEEFERLPLQRQQYLINLHGRKIGNNLIDFHLCIRFRREDVRAPADRSDYWGRTWGADWDNDLKGYVVIRVGDTDVGLRLCS